MVKVEFQYNCTRCSARNEFVTEIREQSRTLEHDCEHCGTHKMFQVQISDEDLKKIAPEMKKKVVKKTKVLRSGRKPSLRRIKKTQIYP